MSRRQWVSVAEHRELRTKQRLLGEELEQVKNELKLEKRRYEAAFGAAQGMRSGKTALTMDALNFMVSEFVAMLPGLDDNRATKGVARRIRAIVGMPAGEGSCKQCGYRWCGCEAPEMQVVPPTDFQMHTATGEELEDIADFYDIERLEPMVHTDSELRELILAAAYRRRSGVCLECNRMPDACDCGRFDREG